MPSQENHTLSDRLLSRYLLGALPKEEAEHLDELSITDEELAGRLDALENDLVDAYVRGELSEEKLTQFKTFYLSSPKRRQKVEFAEGLLALEHRAATALAKAKARNLAISGPTEEPLSPWRILSFPRRGFQGGLIAASLLIVVLSGYLLFQNSQLRKQMTAAQAQHTSLDRRAQELEKQLNQERVAKAEALNELEHAHESRTNLDELKTVSLLLSPPMRGTAQVPTIFLPPRTDLMVLILSLESDDFPAYRAKLRDPIANQILWRSANLTTVSAGEKKTVSLSFRATLLKQQNYILELTGIPNHGAAEAIGGYPFRVVQ